MSEPIEELRAEVLRSMGAHSKCPSCNAAVLSMNVVQLLNLLDELKLEAHRQCLTPPTSS